MRVTGWLRRVFPRILTVVALILAVIGIGIGLIVDSRYSGFLTAHPVTSNLIAGFLGLPAAFLIVNLAAERAIRWGEMARWDTIRHAAFDSVVSIWSNHRWRFLIRYGLNEGTEDARGRTDPLTFLFFLQTNALLMLLAKRNPEAIRQQDSHRLRHTLESVRRYHDAIEQSGEIGNLLDSLRMVYFPRITSHTDNPETVSLIRSVEDHMVILDAAWLHYKQVGASEGLRSMCESATHDNFPMNLSDDDTAVWLSSLAALSSLNEYASNLTAHIDVLVDHIRNLDT